MILPRDTIANLSGALLLSLAEGFLLSPASLWKGSAVARAPHSRAAVRTCGTPLTLHSTLTSAPADVPWTLDATKYGAFDQHLDWGFACSSTPPTACDSYIIDDVQGEIPKDLVGSGTFYKVGPGNFERGGRNYEHMLDGDGFIAAFAFQEDGNVKYTGRFVETEYYKEEREENRIKYRSVFGTQRPGGALANAFDLTLKNVANTNVLCWGGRLFVLWEAGRPYELDPGTLETLPANSEDGPLADLGGIDCRVRGIAIDEGGPIDRLVNVGRSFTAHPHVWDDDTLVAFKTETNAQTKDLTLEFVEYNADFEEKKSTKYSINDSPPPHDFSISRNHYSFFENPYSETDNAKYVLGSRAPAQIMQLALRRPTRLHLVPRSTDDGDDRRPITMFLPASYFNIHMNGISEEKDGLLYLYSTGWDLTDERFFPQSQDTVPFLGAWGGPYPDFVGGIVPPSLLYRTVVDLEASEVVSHEEVCPGIVMEFPTQDDLSNNFMYCPIAAHDYTSLPGTGMCRINLETSEIETWWAEHRVFTHEAVPVAKKKTGTGSWLLSPLYDAGKKRTSLAIFDSTAVPSGPVCRLNLKHHVTFGLHSSFSRSKPG